MSERELLRTEPTPVIETTSLSQVFSSTTSMEDGMVNLEETMDIWYPVLFKNNTSLYFRTEDLSENFNMNVYNDSNNTNYNGSVYEDGTFKLATTIGFSILFGLIIFATIVGEF